MNTLETLLHDDLRSAAGSVDIPVSLNAIVTERDRLVRGDRRSRWVRWALVTVVALLALGGLWWAQGTLWRVPDTAVPNPLQSPAEPLPAPTPEPSASPTSEPTPDTTAGPTASGLPGRTVGVYVHYVAEGPSSLNLVRELRQVPAGTPARGALEALFTAPHAPDYVTLWNPGTRVLGISKHDDVITVDLSREALAFNLGVAGEAMMVDQLVWTLTEAFEATDRVLLRVEGRAFETGHDLYDRPLARADATSSPITVVVDTPVHGSTVASPVRVTGLAAAFEATILWTVTRPDGTTVAEGTAMTDEGMALAPFAFDLPALDPGTYVVAITVDDPSGGVAPAPPSDTKEFTVR